MKNKIIILSVLILPLMFYWAITAFSPNSKMDQAVFANNGLPKVIVFSTPMCGECRKISPVIDQAKKNYANKVEIVKINAVDNKPETNKLVTKHKIYAVPTLVYFDKNGNAVKQTMGYMPYEDFEAEIKGLLAN